MKVNGQVCACESSVVYSKSNSWWSFKKRESHDRRFLTNYALIQLWNFHSAKWFLWTTTTKMTMMSQCHLLRLWFAVIRRVLLSLSKSVSLQCAMHLSHDLFSGHCYRPPESRPLKRQLSHFVTFSVSSHRHASNHPHGNGCHDNNNSSRS